MVYCNIFILHRAFKNRVIEVKLTIIGWETWNKTTGKTEDSNCPETELPIREYHEQLSASKLRKFRCTETSDSWKFRFLDHAVAS